MLILGCDRLCDATIPMPRSGAVRPFVRLDVIRPLTADRTLVPKPGDPNHYKVPSDTDQAHRNDLFAARTGPQAVQEVPLTSIALAGHVPVAIDLNQPGSYLNWNIFTISVANLVLIAVMVAIFGAALLLPFPGRHSRHGGSVQEAPEAPEADAAAAYEAAPGDERMWTARVRRRR